MSSSVRTIGLFSAILININVIVGSGIFINLYPLISVAGTGSFCAYLVAAVFLLPVVAVLAALASNQPESGGLYLYSRTYLHPFVGFLCGWGYFLGKSISVGMMANAMVSVGERVFPVLLNVPHLLLVTGYLALLALANIVGASLQGRAQKFFIFAKIVPVVSVLLLLAWHGGAVPFSCEQISVSSLSAMVPIAVFAMIGFEVTCSIAHFFIRPRYTIPRAFISGFLIVAALLSLFQFAASSLLPAHTLQALSGSPAGPLIALAGNYMPQIPSFSWLLTASVYFSILGGSFGILTSNCWNLHRLAAQGHVPGSRWLTKCTVGQVPWVSLLVEVALCVLSVAITTQQVPLQKMSILSVIFSFLCAMMAGMCARSSAGIRLVHPFISFLGFCSTVVLFGVTLHQVFLHGVSVPYILLFAAGVVCAIYCGMREQLMHDPKV